MKAWARTVLRVLRISVEVRGQAPRAPFLLVSNHLSYVDVLVYASMLDCTFVAKSEIRRWPFVGRLCRSVGVIFVDRESRRDAPRANRRIDEALRDGLGVVLFPEGTSSKGACVLPFRSALMQSVAAGGRAVSYAAVTYRVPEGEPHASDSVCWWGDMTFADHAFRLMALSRIEAVVAFGSESILRADRKELAAALWRAVASEFTPLVTEEEECRTAGTW